MSNFPPLVAFSSGLIADRPVAPAVAFEGYWATDERVLYISNTQLQWVPLAANNDIDLQLSIAMVLRAALKTVMDIVNNPIVDGHYELDLLEQPPNQVLASPVVATGQPSFRSLVEADIPNLDAAKIVSGVFANTQIPDLDAAKITSGILALARIPDLDAAKITSGILALARIPDLDASKITSGQLNPSQIPDLDAAKITSGILALARIPDLDAAKITSGILALARIPDLDAAKITTGQFNVSQIPDLDAAKITTGQFNVSQIPDLDAAKITSGILALARIPDLDAAKIVSGVLALARIPDLDAAKIVSGVFSAAQIPDLDAAKITSGVLNVSRIPDLDASKITTGVLAVARIPNLDASKITSGVLASNRINWNAPGSSIGMTSAVPELATQVLRVPLPLTYPSLSTTELVANHNFATDLSSWSGAPDWVWNNGAQHVVGNTTALSQTITVTPQTTYVLYLEITDHTNGSINLKINNDYFVPEVEYISYSSYAFLTPSTTTSVTISFEPTATFNGKLNTVSVKQALPSALDNGMFLVNSNFAAVSSTTTAPYIGRNNGALTVGTIGDSSLVEGNGSVILGQLITNPKNTRVIYGVLIGQNVAWRSANIASSVIIGADAGDSVAAKPSNFSESVVVGRSAAAYLSGNVHNNVVIGHQALTSALGSMANPRNNTIIGHNAGVSSVGNNYFNVTAIGASAVMHSNNITDTIAIGTNAGQNSSAKRSIYIGNNVGSSNATDDRLIIDNKDTTTPLIDAIMGASPNNSFFNLNAALNIAGGLKLLPIKAVTSNYTLTTHDFMIVARTAGININFPDALSEIGKVYIIQNASGGAINLIAPSNNTIMFANTLGNPYSFSNNSRAIFIGAGLAFNATIKRWQSIN